MIGDLGAPELLIIFAIVILLFGAGKVGRLGKDLGTSVREFRSALRDDKDKNEEPQLQLSANTELPLESPTGAAPNGLSAKPPGIF